MTGKGRQEDHRVRAPSPESRMSPWMDLGRRLIIRVGFVFLEKLAPDRRLIQGPIRGRRRGGDGQIQGRWGAWRKPCPWGGEDTQIQSTLVPSFL